MLKIYNSHCINIHLHDSEVRVFVRSGGKTGGNEKVADYSLLSVVDSGKKGEVLVVVVSIKLSSDDVIKSVNNSIVSSSILDDGASRRHMANNENKVTI